MSTLSRGYRKKGGKRPMSMKKRGGKSAMSMRKRGGKSAMSMRKRGGKSAMSMKKRGGGKYRTGYLALDDLGLLDEGLLFMAAPVSISKE